MEPDGQRLTHAKLELASVVLHWTWAYREVEYQWGKKTGREVGVAGTKVFGGLHHGQGVELVDPPKPNPRMILAALQVSFRVELVYLSVLSRRSSQLEDW